MISGRAYFVIDQSEPVRLDATCFEDLIPAAPTMAEVSIQCFIIMPFAAKLRPVLDLICSTVDERGDKRVCRADDHFRPGTVIDHGNNHIAHSDFCVADLSGSDPNVMWEAGCAHALGFGASVPQGLRFP